MYELNVQQTELVSGGSEASYELGHEIGEAIGTAIKWAGAITLVWGAITA